MNDEDKTLRRQIIGGLGAGIAAAVAAPVLSVQGEPHKERGAILDLQDPTSKYPKPPFEGQSQPLPGLASKMNPVPDHGEKSYKGSGRLMGRKALITGGD